MNYIELFGISASGKTYFKKRMISSLKSRRKKVFDQKEIIIQFYLRNFDNNFLNYFRSYLALFFYSKSASTVKSFFQRTENYAQYGQRTKGCLKRRYFLTFCESSDKYKMFLLLYL